MTTPVPPEIADQAVKWLVELQAGTASESMRDAWERWRREDPEHERAWKQIESVNLRLKDLPGSLSVALLATPGKGRRRSLKLLVLLASGGAAGWVAKDASLVREWRADHRTGVGERRTVELADGSNVVLNTDSAFDVEFDGVQRTIRLIRGEIMVTTAVDSAPSPRPFLVKTAQGSLRAIGTRFGVRLEGAGTNISVFEGAVELRPAERPEPPLVIPAGYSAMLVRDGYRNLGPLDDGADAWTSGMIVATNMRLDAFLAELSRYRPGRLSWAPETGSLRVSGTYPLGDTDRILAALERTLPVRTQSFTRYWVTVLPRRTAADS